jgi:tRNA pseudouridine38-40 synthase
VAHLVRTIRLDVAYDGTEFHGWQTQPGLRTVQGVLEEALEQALGEPVRLTGAGRTDAGTHARGQVASFASETSLPASALGPILRRLLPADVEVRGASDEKPEFDARRSAVARRYAYRLLDRSDVLLGRFAWHPRRRLEAEGLARATAPLPGTHDCAAFQASGCSSSTSECVVHRAAWRPWEGGLLLDIVADHFLYHMVRNIVGTALHVMGAEDPAGAMLRVLEGRDRRAAGPTAPPVGLTLEQVYYAAEAIG